MSRCFPFPPPNYRKEGKSPAEPIKLFEVHEEAKEKKKEKKKGKERKEKRDKSKEDHNASKHKKHGHKKRKHEEINELPTKDALQKAASAKVANEQLEKSGLTEEHELPSAVPEPCESSESTHSSSKSRKLEAANSTGGSHGTTILRLRLPPQKHKDQRSNPTPVIDEPSFSRRVISRNLKATSATDLKATPASEEPCFHGRSTSKNLKAPTASRPCSLGRATSKDKEISLANEVPCISGSVTSEVLTASSSERPCFSGRATSKDLKVTPAGERSCLLGRVTPQVFRATLAGEGASVSGHSISKDLEVIPAIEAPSCFSVRATETPLLHKPSDNARGLSIKSSKRQSSDNAHNKSAEVPRDQRFDENAHIRSNSGSKGSKRARKMERQFKDLFVSWKPTPLLLDTQPGTEDLSWLFSSSRQPRLESGVSNAVEDLSRASSVCSFQPKAIYLPELEMYQLPYVVPF